MGHLVRDEARHRSIALENAKTQGAKRRSICHFTHAKSDLHSTLLK